MLAERRGGFAPGLGIGFQKRRSAGELVGADFRVVDVHQHAARLHMRVGEDIFGGIDGATGNTAGIQDLDSVIAAQRRQPTFDDGGEEISMGGTRGAGIGAFVVDQVFAGPRPHKTVST